MAKKKSAQYRYLHGYNKTEQDRLIRQAKFFEGGIYDQVSWPKDCTEVLEPGCGVGAQSEILLRRFPDIRITGVDRSQEQLAKAKNHLKKQISQKRMELIRTEGEKLPFGGSEFHGAFICFVLEHVANPVQMLSEIRRVLRAGSPIYCTEVLNASFFFHPYAPATLKYWFEFNDHQWTLGGDPFCGAKLGNHLQEAGFQKIETRVHSYLLDNRMPKTRNAYLKEFYEMIISGAPELLKTKRIDQKLVDEMNREWKAAAKDPNAVLFFSFVQARGEAL